MTNHQPPAERLILLVSDADHAEAAYADLAAAVAAQHDATVQIATLRGTHALAAALELAVARGTRTITLVPLVLGAANAIMREIAGVQRWAHTHWPHVYITVAPPYAAADMLASLLVQNLAATAMRSGVPRHRIAALVLAPRSADADANAEWASVVQRVWERSGVGWASLAFLADGQPTLHAALQRSRQAGDSCVIVLPGLLIHDPRYTWIADAITAARASYAPITMLLALPLASTAAMASIVGVRVAQASQQPQLAHGHTHGDTLLPPRYNNGATVSAAPMGAADLQFDANGDVAWDSMWGDFCDLALAGGPPHRGSLLEPVPVEAVLADPAGYARALAELARGLRMVTALDVRTNGAPGWIGLHCTDEAMALWLLRAIVVENVAVRREGTTLFLPVGPQFRQAYEIKNVVTVVAKTYHYWTEHRAALTP